VDAGSAAPEPSAQVKPVRLFNLYKDSGEVQAKKKASRRGLACMRVIQRITYIAGIVVPLPSSGVSSQNSGRVPHISLCGLYYEVSVIGCGIAVT
jgi:hypothetical protein